MSKYIDPEAVKAAAAYKKNVYPSGVLVTNPLPAYSLSGASGLMNSGATNPILGLAKTPLPLIASLE
jgi:hypothetical protein